VRVNGYLGRDDDDDVVVVVPWLFLSSSFFFRNPHLSSVYRNTCVFWLDRRRKRNEMIYRGFLVNTQRERELTMPFFFLTSPYSDIGDSRRRKREIHRFSDEDDSNG
jgi:hypothetical protein